MNYKLTYADKLCICPILQQVVGFFTVLANIDKLIQDIFGMIFGHDKIAEKYICTLTDVKNNLSTKDYCILTTPNFLNICMEKEQFSFYSSAIICEKVKELNNGYQIRNFDTAQHIKQQEHKSLGNLTTQISTNEDQFSIRLTCDQAMTNYPKSAADKLTEAIKKQINSEYASHIKIINRNIKYYQGYKTNPLRHIVYIIIGIIRCIPIIGTIYSLAVWLKWEDANETLRDIFDRQFGQILFENSGSYDPRCGHPYPFDLKGNPRDYWASRTL